MNTNTPHRRKLRVVAADFLNSLPLTVEMAEDETFAFEYVVPSEGARRIMEEEADIALLPVAALAEIGGLEVVPGPCIGANGRVESVVIVSEVPLDKIERLWVDDASRTSVILAQIFLDSVGKGSLPFVRRSGREIPDLVQGTDAGLLIADVAFKESKRFTYRHDLGDAWKRLTGEPFVFAVWAARPGVLTPEIIERINRRFWDGQARKHRIIDEWSAANDMPREVVADYLDERIQFNLNKSAWYGLQEFFRLASNMRLLPDARVEFASRGTGEGSVPNGFGIFTPEVVPFNKSYGIDRILARAEAGRRISVHDAERLYTEADLVDLGEVAHTIRTRMNPGERVSYIIARNVNYTNVCNVDCNFCGFYRSNDPKRKGYSEGYVLTRETIREKMDELADAEKPARLQRAMHLLRQGLVLLHIEVVYDVVDHDQIVHGFAEVVSERIPRPVLHAVGHAFARGDGAGLVDGTGQFQDGAVEPGVLAADFNGIESVRPTDVQHPRGAGGQLQFAGEFLGGVR